MLPPAVSPGISNARATAFANSTTCACELQDDGPQDDSFHLFSSPFKTESIKLLLCVSAHANFERHLLTLKRTVLRWKTLDLNPQLHHLKLWRISQPIYLLLKLESFI